MQTPSPGDDEPPRESTAIALWSGSALAAQAPSPLSTVARSAEVEAFVAWSGERAAFRTIEFLVVGGAAGVATEVDAYNACTNTWTTVAPLPTARLSPAAALGRDGRVYVIGGQAGASPVAAVEAYDVAQDKWASVAPLLTARSGAGAALGPDGRIYVAGGWIGGSQVTASVEAYDPVTNQWATVASLSQARLYLGLVAGPNGTLYAIGGEDYVCNNFAIVEAYNASSGTWAPVASLPQAQFMANAAALGPNGFIYTFGGEVGSNGCQSGAEGNVFIYDPGKNSWTAGANMPTPVRVAAAAAGPGSNAFLYVMGGFDGAAAVAGVQVYDPVGDTW
jgi:N-acetylneuraminic acid mutarotase